MAAEPASLVPADKGISAEQIQAWWQRGAQRIYRGDERATIGMPCGGVAAGQLYVRGDGTLACFQLDGRTFFSGYGADNYNSQRPAQPIPQGFALAVTGPDGTTQRATLDDDGYDAIEFVGEYPRALIRYRAGAKSVPPVQVDLEVFSPFIPLCARDSAWPATVLHFTLKNSTADPLRVNLGGWLGNLSFGATPEPLTFVRRATAVDGDDVTTMLLDAVEQRPPTPEIPITRVLADLESGTYAGWTASGAALGSAPATGTLPDQQPVAGFQGEHLVNTYAGGDQTTGRLVSDPFKIDLPFLTFLIGGGADAEKTCLRLLVDGQVVRSASGRNEERLARRVWDVRGLAGQTATLEIVDEATGAWGHINVDDLALTNALPPEGADFRPDGLDFGQVALSVLGRGTAGTTWPGQAAFVAGLGQPAASPAASPTTNPAEPVVGTLVAERTLAPGATEEVTFIVSWYFPNLHTGHGRMYTNWFADARDAAVQLARELPRLTAATHLFCDTYYRETTLPWWLNTRLLMPASNLATGTAQWWQTGRFWGWEGVGCCSGTCTHVWNYAQAEAWLFPELVRSVRTMQDLGAGFQETTGLVGFRSDANFAADGQAGTILKCYREHLTSADERFLRTHWSRIKQALEYLISHDPDEDGVIVDDAQHNTYDINFVGANTFVGALYLAALRAGEEMARRVGDTASAERYHTLFTRGQAWTSQHLYNGEYFTQELPAGDARPWQYGAGCLADQLFGQTWAHSLHLGYLYPTEQVRSALRAVFRYDWAPDVGTLNTTYPPERWFARAGEPGLFICTWPRGGRPAEPVRYRDEVWTGIEYQVAAGLAWEGLTDEALLVVHSIERRYDGTHHNPWNEVECGDHYARALASWGMLHALSGFTCDVPAGVLRFAPHVSPADYRAFFCAGTGWGTLAQQRPPEGQVERVTLRWGTLRVAQLELDVGRRAVGNVNVQRSGPGVAGEFKVQHKQDGPLVTLTFSPPLEMQAGQELEVRLSD